MIKNQLIEAVRNRLGAVSSREVGAYVQFVFEAISDALKDGDSVKITNFGVWSTRDKKPQCSYPQQIEFSHFTPTKLNVDD